MSSCAVKRGIITLRDCSNPVTGTCGTCSRTICSEHTASGATGTICVECRARSADSEERGKGLKGLSKNTAPAKDPGVDRYEDDSWAFMYRHHYYTSSHYTPFYSGGYYDSYYDGYDVRSFESTEESAAGEDVGEDGGGFYDS